MDSSPSIWREIDVSENYLVSCMFAEAASSSSSILQRLCDPGSLKARELIGLDEMVESISMVYVQSLKELGRTSELFSELKALFGSVTAIPVQVLLIGACFQISEGYSSGLKAVLEEFLSGWKYIRGESYFLKNAKVQGTTSAGCMDYSVLGVEKYLEVTEAYAVTLLGTILRDTELAIAWVEKAELPEENRQEMLRRLRSLCSLKDSKSSLRPGTPDIEERTGKQTKLGSEGFSRESESQKWGNGEKKEHNFSVTHLDQLSKQMEPCFWWFRTVTLKFGNARLVLSRGGVVLWSTFILIIVYLLRRKGNAFKRIITTKAASAKRALIDAWQLAFSFQLNPLAAVQPLPPAMSGNGR